MLQTLVAKSTFHYINDSLFKAIFGSEWVDLILPQKKHKIVRKWCDLTSSGLSLFPILCDKKKTDHESPPSPQNASFTWFLLAAEGPTPLNDVPILLHWTKSLWLEFKFLVYKATDFFSNSFSLKIIIVGSLQWQTKIRSRPHFFRSRGSMMTSISW